jgi:hypothetical protein
MTRRARELLEEALRLDAEDRAALAASLAESLDGPAQEVADRAWAAELEGRAREALRGEEGGTECGLYFERALARRP